jgi:hypothetical protein
VCSYTFLKNLSKDMMEAGRGGTCLQSQHSGGRGRRISEFEASLVYKVSARTPRAIQRNPVSKKKKKKNNNNNNKDVMVCISLAQGVALLGGVALLD